MQHKIEMEEKKFLHDYHDAFYKLFHIPLDWIGPNKKKFTICSKEHCNPLCIKLMGHAEGVRLCSALEELTISTAKEQKRPIIRQCHAGFHDVTIPIFSAQQYIGCLCIGQFLLKKMRPAEITKIRENLSFYPFAKGELEECLKQARIFTEEELEGLIQLVQMLGEFICESYGRIRFLESVNRTDPIQAAELYIQNHYTQTLTVDSIARSVGLSKSYFLHKFSEQTGVSPIAYLNQYRIEKASELLVGSNLTVGEISDYCGFGSLAMFFRHFRKTYGTNPQNYRNAKEVRTQKK